MRASKCYSFQTVCDVLVVYACELQMYSNQRQHLLACKPSDWPPPQSISQLNCLEHCRTQVAVLRDRIVKLNGMVSGEMQGEDAVLRECDERLLEDAGQLIVTQFELVALKCLEYTETHSFSHYLRLVADARLSHEEMASSIFASLKLFEGVRGAGFNCLLRMAVDVIVTVPSIDAA